MHASGLSNKLDGPCASCRAALSIFVVHELILLAMSNTPSALVGLHIVLKKYNSSKMK
jgi:hypothetical protein